MIHTLMWTGLGLATASLNALMMGLQEHWKVEGLILSMWCKVACFIVTFPLVLKYGLPENPFFYLFCALSAVVFAISDVIFFRHISTSGAGVVSRLMPITIFLNFLLWFAVTPSLIFDYLEKPMMSAGIVFVLLGVAVCGSMLRKCSVSMSALRETWFCILAGGILGPFLLMFVAQTSAALQGAIAFTFVEAGMMLALWTGLCVYTRPFPAKAFFTPYTAKAGLIIGSVMAVMVVTMTASYYFIDNPAYISVMMQLTAVLILLWHRWRGKRDESNIYAGMGIVACAVLLIVLKMQI